MKFKINNRNWEIKELSQEEIKRDYSNHKCGNCGDNGRYFGVTWFDNYKIYIDKDLCLEQKKQTLIHELTHCYIGMYIVHLDKKYDEEQVCDINSNSHDIIHKIVEDYFKGGINK